MPMTSSSHQNVLLQALSTLTLAPDHAGQVYPQLCELTENEFAELASLADSNHVVLRALEPLQNMAQKCGDTVLASRCQACIQQEKLRIINAVQHLQLITGALEAAGCPTTVMKTLDHWPDLGNDLDLYTTANAKQVRDLMTTRSRSHRATKLGRSSRQ